MLPAENHQESLEEKRIEIILFDGWKLIDFIEKSGQYIYQPELADAIDFRSCDMHEPVVNNQS